MSKTWQEEKAEDVARLTDSVQVLVGVTIISAKGQGHDEDCDSVNQIVLETTKGTFVLTGDYGGYTGLSCDEYYEKIRISAPATDGEG